MPGRLVDISLDRSSLCLFSSASLAFFARISSLRCCIMAATRTHLGATSSYESRRGRRYVSRSDMRVQRSSGSDLAEEVAAVEWETARVN